MPTGYSFLGGGSWAWPINTLILKTFVNIYQQMKAPMLMMVARMVQYNIPFHLYSEKNKHFMLVRNQRIRLRGLKITYFIFKPLKPCCLIYSL
jgi:hypothetical protein